MVQRIGGFRRKTRYKLSKDRREKGKISLTKYFQAFNEGDRVKLLAEPAIQKGMYFPRFHGKNGKIEGKRGECYKVLIKDGNKEKILIVHPIHLRKVE
jgi:large subunit ribosomal protein L21e